MVVIQDPVVEPFTGSALAVNGTVKAAVPGDPGMEAQVSVGIQVNSAPVAAL